MTPAASIIAASASVMRSSVTTVDARSSGATIIAERLRNFEASTRTTRRCMSRLTLLACQLLVAIVAVGMISGSASAMPSADSPCAPMNMRRARKCAMPSFSNGDRMRLCSR